MRRAGAAASGRQWARFERELSDRLRLALRAAVWFPYHLRVEGQAEGLLVEAGAAAGMELGAHLPGRTVMYIWPGSIIVVFEQRRHEVVFLRADYGTGGNSGPSDRALPIESECGRT